MSRVYDKQPHELAPGEYVKSRIEDHGWEYDAWWYCSPNGLVGRLAMPEDVILGRAKNGAHHVEEHDDGEISVVTVPGNSNSIKVTGWPFDGGLREHGEPLKEWHGWIRHGEWQSV